MEIEIRQVDAMRVACMRHVGRYADVEVVWKKMILWAATHGQLSPTMTALGICHDDPEVFTEQEIRYDACLVVAPDFEPKGKVHVLDIEGGDYAVAIHMGPYDTLGDTYRLLCDQWIPEHGRKVRDALSFEIYRNSPQTTKPENLRTEVHIPLEPA